MFLATAVSTFPTFLAFFPAFVATFAFVAFALAVTFSLWIASRGWWGTYWS
jgi:hypothetical protein